MIFDPENPAACRSLPSQRWTNELEGERRGAEVDFTQASTHLSLERRSMWHLTLPGSVWICAIDAELHLTCKDNQRVKALLFLVLDDHTL